jgi:hypothetical protein
LDGHFFKKNNRSKKVLKGTSPEYPLLIYCCYVPQDEKLYQGLKQTIHSIQKVETIQEWQRQYIMPGQDWRHEIEKHINAADIFIILLSASFVDSDRYDAEVKRALERYHEGTLHIIPILARELILPPELRTLTVLPSDQRSIEKWTSKSAAWVDIEQGILNVVQHIKRKNQNDFLHFSATRKAKQGEVPLARTFSLVHSTGREKTYHLYFPALNSSLLIGRDEKADIRLAEGDKKASRYHCTLAWTADGIEVCDHSSRNGTFVNGQRVDRAIIRHKDSLRCGRTVFFFEDSGATESEDEELNNTTQI